MLNLSAERRLVSASKTTGHVARFLATSRLRDGALFRDPSPVGDIPFTSPRCFLFKAGSAGRNWTFYHVMLTKVSIYTNRPRALISSSKIKSKTNTPLFPLSRGDRYANYLNKISNKLHHFAECEESILCIKSC